MQGIIYDDYVDFTWKSPYTLVRLIFAKIREDTRSRIHSLCESFLSSIIPKVACI